MELKIRSFVLRLISLAVHMLEHTFYFDELMQLGKLCVIADGDLSDVIQQQASNLQSFVAYVFFKFDVRYFLTLVIKNGNLREAKRQTKVCFLKTNL